MAFDMFDEFVHFITWPHSVAYILYILAKYVSFLFYREGAVRLFKLLVNAFPGCYFCSFCNCSESANNLITKAFNLNMEFDRWLIKLLLGREEGVVERHHDDYRPDEDSEGKSFAPIYIRNKSLSSNEVGILSTLVFAFGLLICITAFDIYFLDVSYACTEDTSFNCFVVPVDVNANESELGITNKRIDSCSPWENTSISDQVYVVCYKWVFNFKGMTVAVGGLLTLFQLTIKATTSIFISLSAFLRKNDYRTVTKKRLRSIRIIFSSIVFIVECMTLAIVMSYTTSYFTGGGYDTVVRYLNEHGNQVLLIFGIIATCLLLPIEDYIQEPTQQNELSVNGRYQTNYGSIEASV